ncbi:MAG TPA: DHA2 family efflux MFS transporter permease subunit [Gemmatimonadaceae bacterium]|jgi:DHA2 family multidrug resistance protein
MALPIRARIAQEETKKSQIHLEPSAPTPRAAADPFAYKWLIAAGVILAAVMELIDSSIVNVAFSQMSGNLGATIDEITWVAVGYILAAVIVLPMTGWLAARFGRKRYFLASVALFTVASVLCGVATSLESLVVWRIVQGLGGGALIATSQAILYESFPAHEKALASALFGIGMMVGPALGPTLGGIIVERYTWPWIFLVNVPFGLIAFALIATYYRADPPRSADVGRVDAAGFALLAIGIGALQFVLERGEHYDWFESKLIVGLTVTATLAIVGMVWWELRTAKPVLDLRVFKHRSLTAATLSATAVGMALYGSVFALPLYMQSLLRYTAETAGYVLLPSAIASAVSMLSAARLMKVVSARTLVGVGTVVLAASMFMNGSLTTISGRGDMFLPVVMRGVGFGLIFVPITTLAFFGLTPRELPHGAALFNLSRQMGGSIGIALVATKLITATATHRADLVERVTADDPVTRAQIAGMTTQARLTSPDDFTAARRALAMLDRRVEAQAQMLAYRDAFAFLGIVVVGSLPLVVLFRGGSTGAAAPTDVH